MRNMLSQIIVGVIVTVLGGFITHALVRGHGKGAHAKAPLPIAASERH